MNSKGGVKSISFSIYNASIMWFLFMIVTTLIFFLCMPNHAMATQGSLTSIQASSSNFFVDNNTIITPGHIYENPSVSGGANGNVGIYGFENATSFQFFNSGIINLPAGPNSSYGMLAYTDNGNHLLNNSGSISSNSYGNYDARAYGMQARASHDGSQSMLNSGSVSVATTGDNSPAYAMEAYAGHNGNHVMYNSGYLEAIATGFSSHNYGMNAYVANDGNHTLTNSGLIVAKVYGADSNANGMDAASNNTGNHTVINTGTIMALAQSTSINSHATYANGINVFVKQQGNHFVNNSGTIFVTAIGNKSRAYGADVNSDNIGSHTVINSGNIISTSSGDGSRAYGMRSAAGDSGNQTMVNSGFISAVNNFILGASDSPAHGLVADNINSNSSGSHTLVNSGYINVVAHNTTSHAHAMRAYSTYGQHMLANSGTLVAKAYGNASEAFGLYVQGIPAAGTMHMVHNTGVISTYSAQGQAFEVYGSNDYGIGTFATTLRDWTYRDAVFGASGGGDVNFVNTKLILRPQLTQHGAILNKTYAVRNMMVVDDIQGAVNQISGNVATAVTEAPFLKAVLSGHDPKTAQVRIEDNVNAHTTPGNVTKMQSLNITQGQMQNIAQALRSINYADVTLEVASPQNQWQLFLTPYLNFDNNSSYEFHGNTVGVSAGASYRASDSFSFGAHIDFNSSDYYANIMDLESQSLSFALGLHATYYILPNWYISGQLSGTFNQTDNIYNLSDDMPLDAHNTVQGNAVYAALTSAYVLNFAKGHSLTPEIGLSYLGMQTNAYDIKWDNANTGLNDLYDMHYADNFYNAWYGTLNLTWRSEWALQENASIALTAGLGLRQNLSGHGIETNFRTLGHDYSTSSFEDSSTWLANMGFSYKKDNLSISLNYAGDFGVKQTSHGGSVMLRVEF